jgi:hypothetical protein
VACAVRSAGGCCSRGGGGGGDGNTFARDRLLLLAGTCGREMPAPAGRRQAATTGWEMDRWSKIWVDGGGNVSEVSGGESVRNDDSWSTFHETSLY